LQALFSSARIFICDILYFNIGIEQMSMKLFRSFIAGQTRFPSDVAQALPRIASATIPKFPARKLVADLRFETEITLNKPTVH
jgi:hypothetical protein